MSAAGRRWWQLGKTPLQHDARDLGATIRTPVPPASTHLVAVVSPHGNTGTTTTVASLGAILASERDDQIIAVDANDGMLGRYAPAPGTRVSLRALAARLGERDFDIREFTSRTPSGLEILSEAVVTAASGEPLDAVTYSALLTALRPYGVVLSDCATGVDGLATFVALTGADQQIFVSSLSESSFAATADALATYRYLADRSHVVLTGVSDSSTRVDVREAVDHLSGSCRSVVVVPFDEGLADGGWADPARMQDATWEAYWQLAAAVAAGFPQTKLQRLSQPGEDGDPAAGPSPSASGPLPRDVLPEVGDGVNQPRRTAAGPGFEDSRYGDLPDDASDLNPVGRSLMREERRAALESQSAYWEPQHPSYDEPYFAPNSDLTQNNEGGYSEPSYAEPVEEDRSAGRTSAPEATQFEEPSYQDDWPQQDDDRSSYTLEGESAHATEVGEPDRVGFERPGPAPAAARGSLTDAGLPRRGAATSSTGQQRMNQDSSDAAETGGDWRSANDERWRQASQPRKPKTGGGTSSGLPRRVPRANLVEGAADVTAQAGPQVSRKPEDVRGRLSSLRRGLQRGRYAGDGASGQHPPQTAGSGLDRGDGAAGREGSTPRRPLGSGGRLGSDAGSAENRGAAPRPAMTQPVPRAERPPAPGAGSDGLSEPHYLVAELAEQAGQDCEIPLLVRINRLPSYSGGSARMRPFPVPREGAQLQIAIEVHGLHALGHLHQELTVYPGEDSDPVCFGLRTVEPGKHKVTVSAFHKGTYLGAVHCEISVTPSGTARNGPPRLAVLSGLAFEPGEATLQVRRDPKDGSFSFQLWSETCYPPEQFSFRGGDPRRAAEQIYAQLREAASRAGRGSPHETDRLRDRLRNQGVQLWASAVPEAIQDQFWKESHRITSFTVLGEHDFVPWELLYPLAPSRDKGFLAEWLPVVRRLYLHDRVHQLSLPGAAFVMPPDSPEEAATEIALVRKLLGPGVTDAGVLTRRAELTELVERGHAGLLHFACHNMFSGSGSRVKMGNDDSFEPIDLAAAVQTRSLIAHQPLVFFNACRSAGQIDWFNSALGWAEQFMHAGAGAFIGTLWPVRSRSAMEFAEAFYSELLDAGQPLGQASLAARKAIRDRDGDPTWLAYTVYGSPSATATTKASS